MTQRKRADIPNMWEFNDGAGVIVIDGKSQWPDMLSINLSYKEAVRLIQTIANQLDLNLWDTVRLTMLGELKDATETEIKTGKAE